MTPDQLRSRLASFGQAWDQLDVQPLVDRLPTLLRRLVADADEAERIDELAHRIDRLPGRPASGPVDVENDDALQELYDFLDRELGEERRTAIRRLDAHRALVEPFDFEAELRMVVRRKAGDGVPASLLGKVRKALEAEARFDSQDGTLGRVHEPSKPKVVGLDPEGSTATTSAGRFPAHNTHTKVRDRRLGADLWTAIGGNGIDVCYQPKVEMATGIVRGAEALLRWYHPRLGRVSPSELVAVAERTGAIRPLTMWVMQHALGQCRAWRDAGWDLSVAVNLSARNLVDRHLTSDVARLSDEIGVPPTSLIVEITETMMVGETQRSLDVLQGLVDLGVKISCDDFGTGYASLARLRRLPIHELKVDRSFVSRMSQNDTDRAITRSVIAIGRGLGLSVVAEGVEDPDGWDILRAFGCDQAQGFLISRPLHANKFRAWIARQPASARPPLPQASQDTTSRATQ